MQFTNKPTPVLCCPIIFAGEKETSDLDLEGVLYGSDFDRQHIRRQSSLRWSSH